jgi:DNA-binding NtrC family response regulator
MSAVSESLPGPDAPRKNIVLVVEDEVLIRWAIADHLRDAGFGVIEASNAREARDVIASRTVVDIVFTDVHLPGDMDGFELADWIGLHNPHLLVLITSGSPSIWRPERHAGRPFLSKPYNLVHVEQRLRRLLARRDAASSQDPVDAPLNIPKEA